MSALTRYSHAQVAAWESRTVEPIEIGQLGEWTRQEWKGARDHLPPNERYIELSKGVRITFERCSPQDIDAVCSAIRFEPSVA